MRLSLKLWHILLYTAAPIFSAAIEKPEQSCFMEKQLIHGIERGDPDAVFALIENGASINWKNAKGKNSLIYACKGTNPNIAHYLLSKRADATIISNKGKTPLIYLLQNPSLAEELSLLVALKRAEIASGKVLLSENCALHLGLMRLQKDISEIPVIHKRKLESSSEQDEFFAAPLPIISKAAIVEKYIKEPEGAVQLTGIIDVLSSLRISPFSKDSGLSGEILRPIAKKS